MASSGKCNHEPSSCMSGDGDSPDRHPHERRGNASPGALGRKDDMQPEELAKPLGTVAVQILHSPCIKVRGGARKKCINATSRLFRRRTNRATQYRDISIQD